MYPASPGGGVMATGNQGALWVTYVSAPAYPLPSLPCRRRYPPALACLPDSPEPCPRRGRWLMSPRPSRYPADEIPNGPAMKLIFATGSDSQTSTVYFNLV